MTLVLFDFDGTLTTRDTLWEFISFCHSRTKTWVGFVVLSPWLGLLALRIISAEKAKQKVLAYFFKGKRRNELEQAGEDFCARRLPEIMNAEVLSRFEAYLKQNAVVCVVTASCSEWVVPFCRKYRCDLISTELHYSNGLYSGAFSTPNCNREEKAVRIRARYDLSAFNHIAAFGNRGGDDAMLNLAHERTII